MRSYWTPLFASLIFDLVENAKKTIPAANTTKKRMPMIKPEMIRFVPFRLRSAANDSFWAKMEENENFINRPNTKSKKAKAVIEPPKQTKIVPMIRKVRKERICVFSGLASINQIYSILASKAGKPSWNPVISVSIPVCPFKRMTSCSWSSRS